MTARCGGWATSAADQDRLRCLLHGKVKHSDRRHERGAKNRNRLLLVGGVAALRCCTAAARAASLGH